jgi:hypothetical protein
MFDGNMFFPEQGMPILKMDLKRMLLAEALPLPFSVAMQMLTSLTVDWLIAVMPSRGSAMFGNRRRPGPALAQL